jgi:hypothetical protein
MFGSIEIDWNNREHPNVTQDGVHCEYLNVERSTYFDKLIPVTDICDVSSNFITLEEFQNDYYMSTKWEVNDKFGYITAFNVDLIAELFLKDLSTYKGKRKWHPVLPVLSKYEIDTAYYNEISNALGKSGKFETKFTYFKGAGNMMFASKEFLQNVKKHTPKKIYKLGKTRTELRGVWQGLTSVLEKEFKERKIPITIHNYNYQNMDVVVKTAKMVGITIADIEKSGGYYWNNNSKDFKKIWRSPSKYVVRSAKMEAELKKEKQNG